MRSYSRTTLSAMSVAALCAMQGASGIAIAGPLQPCSSRGLATLVVTIRDRPTQIPLRGALLTAIWQQDGDQSTRLYTDSVGRATICAPPTQPITLQASYQQVRSPVHTMMLALGMPAAHTIELDPPTALLRGVVRDELTGSPIPNARLVIANTSLTAVTARDGAFRFDRLPMGEYEVRVTHIGYASMVAPLDVRRDALDAVVRLSPTVIALEPLIVTEFSRRLDHVGFYARERRGNGIFLNRGQIEAMNAQTSGDLLRSVPSVRLIPQWPGRNDPRMDVSGRGNCRFSYFVDGARMLPDFRIDFIAPYAIEGIEVYRSAAEAPAIFRAAVTRDSRSTPCGVIAIWTRNSR
jgi:hypothetical protein